MCLNPACLASCIKDSSIHTTDNAFRLCQTVITIRVCTYTLSLTTYCDSSNSVTKNLFIDEAMLILEDIFNTHNLHNMKKWEPHGHMLFIFIAGLLGDSLTVSDMLPWWVNIETLLYLPGISIATIVERCTFPCF